MVTDNSPTGVVVGVDGSMSSLQAVDWAIGEARGTGAPMHVLYAYQPPRSGMVRRSFPDTRARDLIRAAGESLVAEAADRCRRHAPDVRVTTEVVEAPPVRALLTASGTAQIVVVGSRGLSTFARAVLGSVSAELAAHADCPVAIVRGREDGTVATGPVVVGVDSVETADPLLEIGFDAAARRDGRLVIVHAWGDLLYMESLEMVGAFADHEAHVERMLSELAARWAPKFPGVGAETQVARDRPAAALVELASTAALLVIGARGHGGFPGLRLGSVARSLVHYAECPVLLVRGARAAAHDTAHA